MSCIHLVISTCISTGDSSDLEAAAASATPSDQPEGKPLATTEPTQRIPTTVATPSDQPQDSPVTIAECTKQPEIPLTEANITTETLEENIEEEIQNLESQFWDIMDKAANHLETTRLSDLKRCITQLPVSVKYQYVRFLQGNLSAINNATSVDEVFSILSLYWDFLNCGLLDVIVRRLGNDETKQLMEQYKVKLREFRMKTKLGDYIGKGKGSNPRYFTEFTTELGGDWRERTLEDLEQFRIKLARLMQVEEYALHFNRVQPGSVSVTWAIPSSLPGIANTLQSTFPLLEEEYDVLKVVFQGKRILKLRELEVRFYYHNIL